MSKYYGYTRVSTETQAEKGGGLNVQRAAIDRYAQDHGITIDGYFCDAGISGTTESRPDLDKLLLETVADGDAIIVHNTSRLWRDMFAQATIMKSVMKANARIISIDEPEFDVYRFMTDPNNFMISGMMGMLDQWERMTIARKLARGRAAKAANGDKPAGVCPFGYRYADDKKSVVVAPADAAIVKRMFSEAQKGSSLADIAATITGMGSRAPRGGEWTKGSVQAILKNRFYTGVVLHQGQEIPGNHEPIISKIQFGKVQAALKRRHK